MTEATRRVLTLKSQGTEPESDQDRQIEIGTFDVLLPCRRFTVVHKVAELGKMSLMTEFLLRLVRAVDGISESDVSEFFGYDPREMSFVLSEAVEKRGYLERKGGKLWLSSEGRAAFRDGGDTPQVYEVEQRTARPGFDLIALAPADAESLSEADRALPELIPSQPDRVSTAAKLVREDRFKRFFHEFRFRGDAKGMLRNLYSIDHVKPSDRFNSVVRITARSSSLHPSAPEPNLDFWKSGFELEDRMEVVGAAAAFLDSLKISKRPDDQDAYWCLNLMAPEMLKDFMYGSTFSVDRFYNEALARVGEFRSDRPTVPVLGSLFTEGNVARLLDALNYAARRDARSKSRVANTAQDSKAKNDVSPRGLFWVIPVVPGWGVTRVLPGMIEQIGSTRGTDGTAEDDSLPFSSVAVSTAQPSRYVEQNFDHFIGIGPHTDLSRRLEVMLIPGQVAAVLVHAPIRSQEGVPVPLGIMSFDRKVIAQTHRLVKQIIPEMGQTKNDRDQSLGQVKISHSEEFVNKFLSWQMEDGD